MGMALPIVVLFLLKFCSAIRPPYFRSLDNSRSHFASIPDFGGVGDGKTLNTKAFQDAITYLSLFSQQGGATLYVPNGTWLTGCFNLTSNFTLYLENGAVILGSQDPEDWPVIQGLPSYGNGNLRYSSLIYGEDLYDVVITGENGTIDGQGAVWWNWFKKKSLPYERGFLVEFKASSYIVLSHTVFKNSPAWTIHPVYCSNVVIDHVTVLAPHSSPNTDGIDPDSCSNVFISSSYIETGDDSIAIKSGLDEYGIEFGRPSTHIYIKDVTTINHNGIALGSEMSGGISNVFIEGVSITDSKTGIHVKTAAGRGGYIANVSFSNISMQNVPTALAFNSFYDKHPDNNFDPNAYPIVTNISIFGLQGSNISKLVGNFRGLDKEPYTNICLSNVNISGHWEHAWNCTNVQGFSENVIPKACPQFEYLTDFSKCYWGEISEVIF